MCVLPLLIEKDTDESKGDSIKEIRKFVFYVIKEHSIL